MFNVQLPAEIKDIVYITISSGMEHDCADLDDCIKCRSVAAFVEARRLMGNEQKQNLQYVHKNTGYSDIFANDDENNQLENQDIIGIQSDVDSISIFANDDENNQLENQDIRGIQPDVDIISIFANDYENNQLENQDSIQSDTCLLYTSPSPRDS